MRSFALTWILCTNHAFAWITISFQRVAETNRRTSLKVSLSGDINNSDSEVRSPLGASIEELSNILGGRGRALACWECLRIGVDPSWYFSKEANEKEPQTFDMNTNGGIEKNELNIQGVLGKQAYFSLANMANVERDVAKLTQICTSVDGTKKFLLQLRDGLEIESVIIPWDDRGSSTLCISSQVGCRQGCTFCATGRMGKLRSLSRDEILSQVYWANKICRLENTLYRMENIVFMGMGEPGDNVEEVIAATNTLVDHNMFGFASKRVTISTVGPHPDVFAKIAEAPAVIAWSVHATRQEVRNALVPTTKFSMEELREGLLTALEGRSRSLNSTMLEVTLLRGINDSVEDALSLIAFCRPIQEKVAKLVVNLIPWNSIGASSGYLSLFEPPSPESVIAFQSILTKNGIRCYVRTTRGDDENAACGQLATKRKARVNVIAAKS